MIHLGKHYLKHPDSFAVTNGVVEHPAGTPVGDFSAHMRSWCKRVFGTQEVPSEYGVIADTLANLENARITLTPKNESVVMTVMVGVREAFRGPVFHDRDDPDWFGIGVRMACKIAREPS